MSLLNKKTDLMGFTKPLIAVLGLILLASLIYGMGVTGYGLLSKAKPSQVCVVFGNTVHADGTPSKRLKARLDKSLELYRMDYCQKVITSGGLGKEGRDEAKVMREYLLAAGMPSLSVVQDSTGVTTGATIQFVKQYAAEHEIESVIAVSQYFHLLRIRLAFGKAGLKNVSLEAPRFAELRDAYSLPREMVAIPAYMLRR